MESAVTNGIRSAGILESSDMSSFAPCKSPAIADVFRSQARGLNAAIPENDYQSFSPREESNLCLLLRTELF